MTVSRISCKAFDRYQGFQSDPPDDSLYTILDNYFIQLGRPSGKEIKEMELDERGRRGDTTHKMLLAALSHLGYPNYYEDVNLIGHKYWGWTLPDVSMYKEKIISHYVMTQNVFLQIPKEERDRQSSLGTQYRLWRHLQLVGHECYSDEFKIAENVDSLHKHNRLWKYMCEKCNNPEIYYIS